MTAKNDITGDPIATKKTSDAYRSGWDLIFGKKEPEVELTTQVKLNRGTYRVELPESIVKELNLGIGSTLRVSVKDGKLVLTP